MDTNDGFWDESDVKGFDFNDEGGGSQVFGMPSSGVTEQLINQLGGNRGLNFDSLSCEDVPGSKPPQLQDLLSEKALARILDADTVDYSFTKEKLDPKEELKLLRRQYESRWTPPNIKHVLNQILTGQPYSLELFKSLSCKKELLRLAVASGDGNAILAVVLFLSQSLKKSLFHEVLMTSPVAVNHYVNYLTTRMQLHELTDILKMLRRYKDASIKNFSALCHKPNRQITQLKACSAKHFNDNKDRVIVDNFIQLLEWQVDTKVNDLFNTSLVTCLKYACENHWKEAKYTSIHTMAQEQGISDRQSEWTIMTGRAKQKTWVDIDSIFITQSWLRGKKNKSTLPIDRVVVQLHKLEAPPDVLSKYFELIDPLDKRLAVAKKLGFNKVIIDTYATLRDRQALVAFKTSLPLQNEAIIYAENVLRSPSIKWKN